MQRKISERKQIIKAGFGYLVGNYCVRGISLISVPLFARLMSTSDYGIYNTFIAYESILSIFIGLALHSTIKNANQRFEGEIDQYTSSIVLMPLLVFLILLIGTTLFGRFLTKISRLSLNMLYCLILYSFSQCLMMLYQSRLAINYNSWEYLKVSSVNAIANVLLSLLLMLTFFQEKRYLGRAVGSTIVGVVVAIYILCMIMKKAAPRVNMNYWRYGLKIALPIIPHGLGQIVLLQFDRIMIMNLIGDAEAGIYSFSYNIYNMLFIGYSALDTIYGPWVFEKLKNKDNANIQKVAVNLTVVMGIIVVLVSLFSQEIIRILGGVKYAEAQDTLHPILMAGYFAMIYSMVVVTEYFYEKTIYTAIGTCLAAALNVVLNLICIPRYGYVAAAYTTLISYIAYFCIKCSVYLCLD